MVEIRFPIVTFLDGTDFWLKRSDEFYVDGVPHIKMWLIPPGDVKKQLQLKEGDLDTTEDADGIIIRTYPRASFITLSKNPERQRYLMARGWRGNEINLEAPDLDPIIELVNERKQAEFMILQLKARTQQLEQEIIGLSRKSIREQELARKRLGYERTSFELLPKDKIQGAIVATKEPTKSEKKEE